jgi:hypothetical protein
VGQVKRKQIFKISFLNFLRFLINDFTFCNKCCLEFVEMCFAGMKNLSSGSANLSQDLCRLANEKSFKFF